MAFIYLKIYEIIFGCCRKTGYENLRLLKKKEREIMRYHVWSFAKYGYHTFQLGKGIIIGVVLNFLYNFPLKFYFWGEIFNCETHNWLIYPLKSPVNYCQCFWLLDIFLSSAKLLLQIINFPVHALNLKSFWTSLKDPKPCNFF